MNQNAAQSQAPAPSSGYDSFDLGRTFKVPGQSGETIQRIAGRIAGCRTWHLVSGKRRDRGVGPLVPDASVVAGVIITNDGGLQHGILSLTCVR